MLTEISGPGRSFRGFFADARWGPFAWIEPRDDQAHVIGRDFKRALTAVVDLHLELELSLVTHSRKAAPLDDPNPDLNTLGRPGG
jgi:hypothetical protein